MPTETDIRAALEEFAALAGDTCNGFDAASRASQPGSAHLDAADIRPNPAIVHLRHRGVSLGLSAAAVAAVIAGTAALVAAQGSAAHHHGAAQAPDGSRTTNAAPIGTSRATSTEAVVPADALRWSFTVDPIPGYTFNYTDDQPDPRNGQQNASVTSAHDPDLSAGITVYPRGGFDPTHGSVDGTAVDGKTVTVKGHSGTFVTGPSTPTLFWTYAKNSWASVGISGTARDSALPFALRVARAVHTDTPTPITLPFQVGTLPKPLKVVDVAPTNGQGDNVQSTVFYGTSFPNGIYLTVTRISPARVGTMRNAPSKGDHTTSRSRTLPDGSTLWVVLDPNHVKDISQSQLQTIVAGINVTPTLADPSTWLPVGP